MYRGLGDPLEPATFWPHDIYGPGRAVSAYACDNSYDNIPGFSYATVPSLGDAPSDGRQYKRVGKRAVFPASAHGA